jgi:hypothetical protein
VEVQEYKYKGFTQERTMAMDRVSIYAYTCIGLVGAAIIGLIIFDICLDHTLEVPVNPTTVSFCLQSIVP